MRAGTLVLAGWLALTLIGCRDQGDRGEELSYVRGNPDDYEPEGKLSGDLLPLTPGTLWQYKTVDDKGKTGTEELVALPGGVLELRVKGKASTRDTYRSGPDGLFVVGIAQPAPMQISPPLPTVVLPIKEGVVTTWQGTVGTEKNTVMASSWTRVTRREKVKTPAGEFLTWRVDMRTTVVGDKGGSLLVTRWFAPGVGVVRLRSIDAKSRTIKELVAKKTISLVTSGVK